MGILLEGLGKVAGRLGERGSVVSRAAEMSKGYLSRFGRGAEEVAVSAERDFYLWMKSGGRGSRELQVGEVARFPGVLREEARAAEGVRPTLFNQEKAKINTPKREVQPTKRTNGPKTRNKKSSSKTTNKKSSSGSAKNPRQTKTKPVVKASAANKPVSAPHATAASHNPSPAAQPKAKRGMPVNRTRKNKTTTAAAAAATHAPPAAHTPVVPVASAAPGKSPQALAQNGKKIAQHVRDNKLRYALGGGALAAGGGAMMNRTGRGVDKNTGLSRGMYGR